jgi:hypothetical protein
MRPFFSIFLWLGVLGCGSVHAQEIVTLPTRTGVTQSYLLVKPAAGAPQAIALLFPGGAGVLGLRREDDRIEFRPDNFLVRSRDEFVRLGVAAAIVDTPSDHPQGMDDHFRLGNAHGADIAAVVSDLKSRFGDIPLFFIGTSRGTVSAAAAARALGETVAGVVLTSTVFLGGSRVAGPGLSGFDFATIRSPLLFVHHAEDGCRYTPYRSAKAQASRFPLITIDGGDAARSAPCEALSAHGFLGKEQETVEAIVGWMLKKPSDAKPR